MEEESLLKERLQAITDKRRIREDIRHKRRDIEEEKVKLQYIKKKSLREQWLMEGLQSEEEQETMKLQAQDELQRTTQLQSNILRMEKEIEVLEAEELNISANEEAILRRLKAVERTTEDIIKELSVDPFSDVTWPSPLPEDSLSDIFMEPVPPQISVQGPQEPKRATFAMEISVELDKRTGKTQVISTATVTPGIIQEKGLKVYEDGRKSVYALPPGGGTVEEVTKMTHTDVDELLRQATDWSGEVQYHQPIYAAPFTGTPGTPRTSSKTTGLSPVLSKRIGTPNMSHSQAESRFQVYPELEKSKAISLSNNMITTNDLSDSPYAILGSIRTSSEAVMPRPLPVHKNLKTGPFRTIHRYESPKSGTSSPVLSCCESGEEEFKEDMTFDVIQSKHPRKNDICHLISEEMSSLNQPVLKTKQSSSLLTTHRYEFSTDKYRSSPVEFGMYNFSQSKTPSPALSQGERRTEFQSKTISTKSTSCIARQHSDIQSACSDQQASLVSVRASSDRMPTPSQLVYKNIETSSPSPRESGMDSHEINLDRTSPPYTESTVNSLLEELAPGAVTMIFMGYENVDADEEDPIQAEVVVIRENDEEQDFTEEENLAMIYHPNGCTSQIYQPVMGVAKVMEGRFHKPTFRHRDKSEKNLETCVTDR